MSDMLDRIKRMKREKIMNTRLQVKLAKCTADGLVRLATDWNSNQSNDSEINHLRIDGLRTLAVNLQNELAKIIENLEQE